MCGIIGGTNQKWNFTAAVDSLAHRGPDARQFFHNADLTLGFTRLAIIDLSERANQPMCTQDQSIWIVFNGEIYGYKTLRQDLLARKHKFYTESDTEVILNAYLEWGDRFVDHIDGMFAIAIHDLRSKKLRLFRDRVGIKPLYYFHDGKDFAFASELKAFLSLFNGMQLKYDPTAIYDFLTYRYIPGPKSLYKNIYKLLPGHYLNYDLRERAIMFNRPYWQLHVPDKPSPCSVDDACGRLTSLIKNSVEQQIIADVPLGFFLSGGMDSSVVVYEASRLNIKPKTFSIGFEVPSHTETHFAREVAQFCQTDHQEEILSNMDTEGMFPKYKDWFDEPFDENSAFPTYLVSKFARQKVKVVLTGDGGDEVFGGYRWYSMFKNYQKGKLSHNQPLKKMLYALKLPLAPKSFLYKIINELVRYTCDDLECYAKILGGLSHHEKSPYAKILGIPEDYDSYWYFRKYYRTDLPLLTRLQYLDFHTYLPSDILTKVDRTSMATSLEARVPLLSKALIEFSFSLPEEVRYLHGQLKGLLKWAYRKKLPDNIIKRDKKGFSIPQKYTYLSSLKKEQNILSDIFHIDLKSVLDHA